MSKTDAYTTGYHAFFTGKIVCPYQPDTHFAREWQRGFNKAYFENMNEKVLEAA
jgi:ribosome modulation factor